MILMSVCGMECEKSRPPEERNFFGEKTTDFYVARYVDEFYCLYQPYYGTKPARQERLSCQEQKAKLITLNHKQKCPVF